MKKQSNRVNHGGESMGFTVNKLNDDNLCDDKAFKSRDASITPSTRYFVLNKLNWFNLETIEFSPKPLNKWFNFRNFYKREDWKST